MIQSAAMAQALRPRTPVTLNDGGFLRAPARPRQWPWSATPSRFRHCMVLPAAPNWLADLPDHALGPKPRIAAPVPVVAHAVERPRLAVAPEHPGARAPVAAAPAAQGPSPATMGALLFFAPPVGLACVWASPHYGREARLALTAMSALWSLLATAAVLFVVLG